MRRLTVAVMLVAAGLTHLAQRSVDEIRHEAALNTDLLFRPSPVSFELATLGYDEPVADLLWVRAILMFGERHDTGFEPAYGSWLGGLFEAIVALDPTWRTPYYYGGTMLRSIGAIDESDRIFHLAMEAFPDRSYYPFALGMNYYLHRGDPHTAARWITEAASRPDAPAWYRVAAAGLLARKDLIPVAIRFLEEQLETTSDPVLVEMIEGRITSLRHDGLVEAFGQGREMYRGLHGRDIERPEDLELLGNPLPPDPHGEEWVMGADGVVRSSYRERIEAAVARDSERLLLSRR